MSSLNNPIQASDPESEILPSSGNFLIDILPLVLTTILLMIQFFVFKDFTPHIPLAFGLAITGLLIYVRKGKWIDMENHFLKVVRVGLPAIMILLIIGMIIAVWIAAGTVPTILYYGFEFFTPSNFLVSLTLICVAISLATGSSWSTTGTIGLAMMGIGTGLNIPPEVTGGAIVSGAFFGDKMSPLSETTNLTPAATGVDLWDHITNLFPTTIPSLLISLGLYAWLGSTYDTSGANMSLITEMQATLDKNYDLGLITLIPAVVVIVAAVTKLPAVFAGFMGVASGSIIAIFVQDVSLQELFTLLQNGVKSTTGMEIVDNLLSKGGVMSMAWVTLLTILALSFIGGIEYYGSLNAILKKIEKWITNRVSLSAASYTTIIGTGTLIGDVFTTLVLPARLYKDKFEELGYKKTNLTRQIEDCGTLLSPLIPWNMGGSFVAGTLGIATLAYAPYAFFCWLCPVIGFIWALTGIYFPKVRDKDLARHREPAKWEGL
ncbi:Na+/H+ antiporter NhaC [Taylorella asinigenitalis]|uniref:Na+/H+ antiporter NhaC n=1 Tax=Taylorella asinigenitalis TaxID=84590 RepID=UPI00048F27BF|nr:Na+/H+ antiporter NhaC [Taylorella asinigenitalis]